MVIDILKTMNIDQMKKNEIQNAQCPSHGPTVTTTDSISCPPRVSKHCSVTTASCSSCKRSSRSNGAAGLAVVDLLAPLAALVGPREVGDGNDEEGVAGVGDTGKGVVPM
jgi:hypothetical protein